MRIFILSRGAYLYSTQSLINACYRKGHQVRVLDHMQCDLVIGPELYVNHLGDEIREVDAIIPRIGASVTREGAAVVRHFELMGACTTVRADALLRARDKLVTLQILAAHGLPVPRTWAIHHTEQLPFAIKALGGLPLIVKVMESTHGAGVLLAETAQMLLTMVNTLLHSNQPFLLQEYIREAGGADHRMLVVGDRVVAAMRRQASPGEFRSNLHLGGAGVRIVPSPKEQQLALTATRLLGVSVAGVDIIPSSRGPLIMEVNASPGLEGIEHATGVDISGAIVRWLEREVRKSRRRVRREE
ncbi:MAG: RimK family alpha-L-glutamate ligase [Bacteroidetes bacterium]|nr:MAG: RimK family alpha-L-glutamate ligase [Bacteroidota bacterium]